MPGIMAGLGAILAFLTVPPAAGATAMVGWIVGAAFIGYLHGECFQGFRRRRYAIGLLGSRWGDRRLYWLTVVAAADAGYIVGAVALHPDYAFLSAWSMALGGAFVAFLRQKQAEKPVRDRYRERRWERSKVRAEGESLATYLSERLGRRGLLIVCFGEGFDAADYRWWAEHETDYGLDALLGRNWRIRYEGAETIWIEFAGYSWRARPRALEQPYYFYDRRIGPEAPSEHELAERLHRFVAARRGWKLPTKPGGAEPHLGALANLIAALMPDADAPERVAARAPFGVAPFG